MTTDLLTEEKHEENVLPEHEALFRAGVHVAYRKTRRHPNMRKYIAGMRNTVEMFHLERVNEEFMRAKEALVSFGEGSKMVLWVGTKPAAENAIRDIATSLGHPYVNERWLGGTLTNFKMIRGRVTYLEGLEEEFRTSGFEKYTKQERMKREEEMHDLQESFGGLRPLVRLPDAMVVVDSEEETTAAAEARNIKIPLVAIMNSDCDPSIVTYPIPANDNAPKSIQFLLGELRDAYLKGRAQASAKAEVPVEAPERSVA